MRISRSILAGVAIVALCGAILADQPAKPSPKDIVLSAQNQFNQAQKLSVRYWIELDSKQSASCKSTFKDICVSAATRDIDLSVPSTTDFQTGDKFSVMVEANRPAYIYVFNEGTSGRKALIYPTPGSNQQVAAKRPVRLPAEKGIYFEIKPPAGTEKLILVASESPLNFASLGGGAAVQPGPNSTGNQPNSGVSQSELAALQNLKRTSSKSVTFVPPAQQASAAPMEVAAYISSQDASPLYHEFSISHR